MKKISDKQAVKVAKVLNKYCRQQADECGECIFYPQFYDNKCFCEMNFHVEPEMWGIKELKRGPKYDIRSYAPDYSKISKGITLTADEMRKLKAVLNGMEEF